MNLGRAQTDTLEGPSPQKSRTMDIRSLRYFVEVARQKSFTAAAKALFVTQPTLSRQIAELEEELGQVLIDRSTRRVTLTEKGLYLYRQAQSILALMERTKKEAMASESVSGELVISAGESPAFDSVAETLWELMQRYPAVRCRILSSNSQEAAEQLQAGLSDFALIFEPADLSGLDYLQLPVSNRWGLLTRRDGPFQGKTAISPVDLKTVPLLMSKQPLENRFAGWLGYSTEELRVIGRYNLLYNASRLVRQGAHALCLQGIVEEDDTVMFLPLKPDFCVGCVLAWPQVRPKRLLAELFLESMKKKIENFKAQTAAPNETA